MVYLQTSRVHFYKNLNLLFWWIDMQRNTFRRHCNCKFNENADSHNDKKGSPWHSNCFSILPRFKVWSQYIFSLLEIYYLMPSLKVVSHSCGFCIQGLGFCIHGFKCEGNNNRWEEEKWYVHISWFVYIITYDLGLQIYKCFAEIIIFGVVLLAYHCVDLINL